MASQHLPSGNITFRGPSEPDHTFPRLEGASKPACCGLAPTLGPLPAGQSSRFAKNRDRRDDRRHERARNETQGPRVGGLAPLAG